MVYLAVQQYKARSKETGDVYEKESFRAVKLLKGNADFVPRYPLFYYHIPVI